MTSVSTMVDRRGSGPQSKEHILHSHSFLEQQPYVFASQMFETLALEKKLQEKASSLSFT